MLDKFTPKTNIPEERLVRVGMTGTGAAVPTKRVGPGVTLSRTALGVIKITFAKNPGVFLGIHGYCYSADTPSAVKGYTLTGDTFDTTSGVYSIEVSFWTSAFAAVDLAAAQYLDLTIAFAAQSVIT